MGPPTTAKRDASAATAAAGASGRRTDAPRSRERWALPAGHAAGSERSPPRPLAAVEQVEWASPTSIRARSRPSNLHAYLRSNSAFPLSTAASPRPLRRAGAGGSVSSGGSTGATSPRRARSARVRSQSTRATQTSTTDFLIHSEAADARAVVSLGAYGDISRMDRDTVDFLMAALEERRHELAQEDPARSRSSDASSSSEPQATAAFRGHESNRRSAFMDDGNAYDTVSPASEALDVSVAHGGRVRSRSYEALAKLEQILEARHQQLIHDGALDGPVARPLQEPPGSELTEEIRKLQQSFLMEARGQR